MLIFTHLKEQCSRALKSLIWLSLPQRLYSAKNDELIQEMSYFAPSTMYNSLQLPFLARVLKFESNLVKELKHFATNFDLISTKT